MVKISRKIRNLMSEQGVIIVSSVDESWKIPNTTPRTTFHTTSDSIYWIELFLHKSMINFQNYSWVSVTVFDKEKLDGYQLKGKVSIIQDAKEKDKITLTIIDKLTRLHKKRILSHMKKDNPILVKFTPQIIYTLKPIESADIPIVIDANPQIGMLVGGANIESNFGYAWI